LTGQNDASRFPNRRCRDNLPRDLTSRFCKSQSAQLWSDHLQSKSDFWLTLHKLAHDLEREGMSDQERAANVCDVLNALSPATKGVYISNLTAVLSALTEVATHCDDEAK
jgi:hypothetical protein